MSRVKRRDTGKEKHFGYLNRLVIALTGGAHRPERGVRLRGDRRAVGERGEAEQNGGGGRPPRQAAQQADGAAGEVPCHHPGGHHPGGLPGQRLRGGELLRPAGGLAGVAGRDRSAGHAEHHRRDTDHAGAVLLHAGVRRAGAQAHRHEAV